MEVENGFVFKLRSITKARPQYQQSLSSSSAEEVLRMILDEVQNFHAFNLEVRPRPWKDPKVMQIKDWLHKHCPTHLLVMLWHATSLASEENKAYPGRVEVSEDLKDEFQNLDDPLQVFLTWWLFMKPECARHFPQPIQSSDEYSDEDKMFLEMQISFLAEHETNTKSLVCYFKPDFEDTLLSALEKNTEIEEIIFAKDVPEKMLRKITELYNLKKVRFDSGSINCASEEWRLFWEKQKDSVEVYDMCPYFPSSSKHFAYNSYNQAIWFGQIESFCKLKRLMIDDKQMRYLIKEANLEKKTFPSLTELRLSCCWNACSLLSSLDKIRHSVLPNLAHAIITIHDEPFTLKLADILGKFGDVIEDISIVAASKAEFIPHINNPHLVLPNLTKLNMKTAHNTMSYESFMDIFKNCPNLRNVSIWLHNINGFDQNQFIEEVNKKKIGQAIKHFRLSVRNYSTNIDMKLGDLKMVEAMIRNWPNLKNIEDPTWCQLLDLHSFKAFKDFARNYGMEIVDDYEDWNDDSEDWSDDSDNWIDDSEHWIDDSELFSDDAEDWIDDTEVISDDAEDENSDYYY